MKNVDQKKNGDIHDFIEHNSCATIATHKEESAPDLAHVFIYLDMKFNGYFMSKIETRKINNIVKNPHVNLMFSDPESLQQTEYRGNARILDNPDEIALLLPKIQELIQFRRPDYWIPPLAQTKGDGYCVVEITPMSIVYRDYSREEKDSGPKEYEVSL